MFKFYFPKIATDKTTSKQVASDLYAIKNDILKNTNKVENQKYKDLITATREKLPMELSEEDIKDNPQKYMKYMINLNRALLSRGLKALQFFPLRDSNIPHYITLDTKVVIELLEAENKFEKLKKVSDHKDVWNNHFKINFKRKQFQFAYMIKTNGYDVSIQFINKNSLNEKEKKLEAAQKGRDRKKELKNQGLTKEQMNEIKKKEDAEKKKRTKENLKQNKDQYAKLSAQEKETIKKQLERKNLEFLYIDDLTKEEIEELQGTIMIYIDPGKRVLYYMIDDKNNIFRYTFARRLYETKRLKYQRLNLNFRKRTHIQEIEKELNQVNSKSCDTLSFSYYIYTKNIVNMQTSEAYKNEFFRQYKWYSYINALKSDGKLIADIKEKFIGKNKTDRKNKKITIIIGDWSIGKQMRNFKPTPNKRLLRLLARNFKVYLMDEYNTSCINHITEERCENLYLPDKEGKYRKKHAVLTYKMDNKRLGCINRDFNSVNNIRKIVKEYLATGKRPEVYCRKKNEKVPKKKNNAVAENIVPKTEPKQKVNKPITIKMNGVIKV